MSRKYKFRNPDGIYFVTMTVVGWIDVFSRKEYRDIVIQSLKYCQEHKGLRIHAYIIMTNHIHMIISKTGSLDLSSILRDFKKFTSSSIIRAILANSKESRRKWMIRHFRKCGSSNCNNKNYQFWIQGSHPIELVSNFMLDQKLDYIHNNPVKAAIVDDPIAYNYSSQRDYCGYPGLLKIHLMA